MHPKILVAGMIGWETNIQIPGFPLEYQPLHFSFWKNSNVTSGVGINIALALKKLDWDVKLAALLGEDFLGEAMLKQIELWDLPTQGIPRILKESPSTTVLFDETGRRQIHMDLKDLQEQDYPQEDFWKQAQGCDAFIMTPLNLCRAFLPTLKDQGKLIATDLHVLGSPDEEYHQDFLKYSDILFLSNENCLGREKAMVQEITQRFGQKIIVMGLGDQGALLWTRESTEIQHFPIRSPRAVVNTIGAGDSLFASFLNFYLKGDTPERSLERATLYAGWKVGGNGATDGLLTAREFEELEKGQGNS